MPNCRLNPIDSTMASFVIVMFHKLFEPTPRILNFEEAFFRVTSRIFQRLEECFGVRIIIADTRSTVRVAHTKSIENDKRLRSFHRRTIVGMKYELSLPDSVTDKSFSEEFRCECRVICAINSGVYNISTIDIDDHICVEKAPFGAPIA